MRHVGLGNDKRAGNVIRWRETHARTLANALPHSLVPR